jgi:oligogalacturonide lyase
MSSVGRRWPREEVSFNDARTGRLVRQLTAHRAHSHHLYFTNPGWFDDGKRLLFGSDRGNRTNLYSIELATGEITQLTDLEPLPPPREVSFLSSCVNPCRAEAYFWYGSTLLALDLHSLEQRPLYEAPNGMLCHMSNVTADGCFVCAALNEDLSRRIQTDLNRGYVGFPETWAARPHCQVVRVPVDGGTADVVHEEDYWIGHVNTSPTQAHLLSFCHEGPWDKVDHRIWGLDLRDGKAWKIRPQVEGERVGHEYWMADGIHIGYHGTYPDRRQHYGSIRYDNEEHTEAEFPGGSTHFHSNTLELIVGDGSTRDPWLLLWRFRDGRFEGPRLLANHRTSFHIQICHVHPRFSPDGRHVLYTSDASGYGNVCLVEVGDFDDLPARE